METHTSNTSNLSQKYWYKLHKHTKMLAIPDLHFNKTKNYGYESKTSEIFQGENLCI